QGVRARRRSGGRMSAHLLQQAITERAQARPEAAAVLAEDAAPLTYGELDAGSNRLAHMLRELGCRRGDRVVLLMPKSPQAIMSLIGVLKADAAYVPLDTAGPPRRPELSRVGVEVLRHLPLGPRIAALPAAFRSVDLRHLQHARRGRGAAPDAERSEPPAAQDGAVHPQGTPHAVVLGALGPQPH